MIYQTGPLSVRLLKRSDNLLLQNWLSDPAELFWNFTKDVIGLLI